MLEAKKAALAKLMDMLAGEEMAPHKSMTILVANGKDDECPMAEEEDGEESDLVERLKSIRGEK